VGPAVERLKPGDWVCLPFNISCGHCKNCERGLTAYCLNANQPGVAGGAFGFADMGPWPGGQAEYLRVPWADFMALKLPPDAQEKQTDYVMCADIFPTGWHATELAGMKPGDAVVIYGSGPVGLMAAHSAMIKGACSVMVVDCHPDRLKLAKSIGAIPIDYSKEDPVQRVMDLTHGMGADAGCECVGYQCHDPAPHRHEDPKLTMNNLVSSVKFTGGIGVVGVFVPQDPGAPYELAKKGMIEFAWGMCWFKGQRIATGQCNVKAYNRQLRDLIHAGRAKPSFIVSHELKLDQAPDAYQHFDVRDHGWTKVVLHPGS
jgi:threonine dehydrogenase-like Zn-dependent dehydrogenase